MAEAALYRWAEVPFVVRRPPGIGRVPELWADESYIARKKPVWQAEANTNKHFMSVLQFVGHV